METVIHWEWEEAFDKWGFGDKYGANFTDVVAEFLIGLGYDVMSDSWGIHNYMIMSLIDPRGVELMDDDKIEIGYYDPRDYLPKELIEKLDEKFK